LERAVKRGATQYVILGAGLDSFAYRRPDLVDRLRVFEVDHPATQTWKRGRLRELNIAEPPNVVFTPIDFQKESLLDGLRKSGYKLDAPSFFSWLGVTVYLSRTAVFDTLQTVAAMARGSHIIFQYLLPISALDDESRRMDEFIQRYAAAHGEPYLTFFAPGELTEEVRRLGFNIIEDLGPQEANTRYFANRTDGLHLNSSHGRFMTARV